MKKLSARSGSTNRADGAVALHSLCQVALLANRLAKQLSGRDRALAYQIKSEALSALVVSGAANANGMRPDNTVGLDFFGSRLHCPLSNLTPQAHAIIERSGRIPTTTRLSDLLSHAQRESLTSLSNGLAA